MSTVSSGNVSKGEKGKKFQARNINSLFKVSGNESQQKNTAPKHGLQVIGKVPAGRRVPNPVHLPSLKSESGGQDPNIILVQPSSGWLSGSETKSCPTQAGALSGQSPEVALSELKVSQSQEIPPKRPPLLKPQVPSIQPPSVSSVSQASISSVPVQPGQLRPGGGQLPTLRPVANYDRQFPSLGGKGEPIKGTSDVGVEEKQVQALKPNGDRSWTQHGKPLPVDQRKNTMNFGLAQEIPRVPLPVMAPGQDRQPPSVMHPCPRGMPPTYMRPPPLGSYPPYFFPPQISGSMSKGHTYMKDGRQDIAAEGPTIAPIVKAEELNKLDEIAREGGWAIEQEEIDYNQKLSFSDDEDQERKPQIDKKKGASEPRAKRDSRWAERIQAEGKLIEQAMVRFQTEAENCEGEALQKESVSIREDDPRDFLLKPQEPIDDELNGLNGRLTSCNLEEDVTWQEELKYEPNDGQNVFASKNEFNDSCHKDFAGITVKTKGERDRSYDLKSYTRRDFEKESRTPGDKQSRRPVDTGRDARNRAWDSGSRQDNRSNETRDRSFEFRRKDESEKEDYRDNFYAYPRDRAYQRNHGPSTLPPRFQKQQELKRQESLNSNLPNDRLFNQPSKDGRQFVAFGSSVSRSCDVIETSTEQDCMVYQNHDKNEGDVNKVNKEETEDLVSGKISENYVQDYARNLDRDKVNDVRRMNDSAGDIKEAVVTKSQCRSSLNSFEELESDTSDSHRAYGSSKEPEEIPSWADDSSEDSSPVPQLETEKKITSIFEGSGFIDSIGENQQERSKTSVIKKDGSQLKELEINNASQTCESMKRVEISREPRPKLIVVSKDETVFHKLSSHDRRDEGAPKPRAFSGNIDEKRLKLAAPLPISRERVEADIDDDLKQVIASQKKDKCNVSSTQVESISLQIEQKLKLESNEGNNNLSPKEIKQTTERKAEDTSDNAIQEKSDQTVALAQSDKQQVGLEPVKQPKEAIRRSDGTRGKGSRGFSQPSTRGRSECKSGRSNRYYGDDEGDYFYSRKNESKDKFKDKIGKERHGEKLAKDDKKELGSEENKMTNYKCEQEEQRRVSGHGWESSKSERRGGRGARGRGSYGPPSNRPFSSEPEPSSENRPPRFQKVETSQRGRAPLSRKGPNVPPPFSDKKSGGIDSKTECPDTSLNLETVKTDDGKAMAEEFKPEGNYKFNREESIKNERNADNKEPKQKDSIKKELSRSMGDKQEKRDDKKKNEFKDYKDERDRRERSEYREKFDRNSEAKSDPISKQYGKKHKEYESGTVDEEKFKKRRREEKTSSRPFRERRDSGRSGKSSFLREPRQNLPPRLAKLQAQKQKAIFTTETLPSIPSGFEQPPPSSQQSGSTLKVDLNPPPPPPVNAWTKPITETLKQHAAAQQQTPAIQIPPQVPTTSMPPPFALPQKRGEPIKVGQTVQPKPTEIPQPQPSELRTSLIFENTKIKANTEKQPDPIQLPFPLSKTGEDLQLDFTFDASLPTEERTNGSKQDDMTATSKASLSLQRGMVGGLQSPISPSTTDLDLKIQSVKKVWDTMPTVMEHSVEDSVVNRGSPFGKAFSSSPNTSFQKISEANDEPAEDSTSSQSANYHRSSPMSKAEGISKVKTTSPPVYGQHITGMSGQNSVMTHFQHQYNSMPAIASPPMMYNTQNHQSIPGPQQQQFQIQIDGSTVPISMQILNASSQAASRNATAQYSAGQAYNLSIMSPNLSQFGSSGFNQLVPPPNGGPLGNGGGQPSQPPSGTEASLYGAAQHMRVQSAPYGQSSPSPTAAALIIPGSKPATAQFGISVGPQPGYGNIGKPFQQHPGSTAAAQLSQNPFFIYEQAPVLGHVPAMNANFVAGPVLRNNLPHGPPPTGPTSFYSTTNTPAHSPFFPGHTGPQVQAPPPVINQAQSASSNNFGTNQSFSYNTGAFSSHNPGNLQGFGRNQGQMSRPTQLNYSSIGLYKVGMLPAAIPEQLKQMAALGAGDHIAAQYLSPQGSIQLPTTGGALNSHNSGSMHSSVQPAVPSPKTKDQRSVAVSSNRYVPHTFGQAQTRFPAPIQRPAVTQPGNGKPMKLVGNQAGVSSVETFSSQGTRNMNESQSAGSNQDLLGSGGSNNGQPMRKNHAAMATGDSTQTCNQSPSSLELNEVN